MKNDCKQAYGDNQNIVKEKLNAISRLIAEHKKGFESGLCQNWGFVGDLDYLISKLDDIIETIKKD